MSIPLATQPELENKDPWEDGCKGAPWLLHDVVRSCNSHLINRCLCEQLSATKSGWMFVEGETGERLLRRNE